MNKNNRKEQQIHINKNIAIALIVTFCAFLVSLAVMATCMIVNAIEDADDYTVHTGGGGGGSRPNKQPASSLSKPGLKTEIMLPSVTAEGTYLAQTSDKTLDVSADKDIDSAAIVLTDITSGVVVAGKSADERVYPASMTKVMTLLVACENAKDANARLTVTEAMINKYKEPSNKGGSVAFEWKAGYTVTVEDVLHLIIYQSDTFACWLIADYVAGGEAQFVELMNAKAAALGLTSTHFTNCTGLYNIEHYTTCREMAAIMAAAMNNPAATAVLGRNTQYFVDIYQEGQTESTQMGMWCDWYTSRLEKNKYANTAPHYAGKGSDIMIVGGKTGYEDIPTSCFVTAGVDDITGRRYVCVQVGRINKDQTKVDTKTSTFDTREMYWKYAKED